MAVKLNKQPGSTTFIFLNEDMSYEFQLDSSGSEDEIKKIVYQVKFIDYKGQEFPLTDQKHVIIKRDNQTVPFSINKVIESAFESFMPLLDGYAQIQDPKSYKAQVFVSYGEFTFNKQSCESSGGMNQSTNKIEVTLANLMPYESFTKSSLNAMTDSPFLEVPSDSHFWMNVLALKGASLNTKIKVNYKDGTSIERPLIIKGKASTYVPLGGANLYGGYDQSIKSVDFLGKKICYEQCCKNRPSRLDVYFLDQKRSWIPVAFCESFMEEGEFSFDEVCIAANMSVNDGLIYDVKGRFNEKKWLKFSVSKRIYTSHRMLPFYRSLANAVEIRASIFNSSESQKKYTYPVILTSKSIPTYSSEGIYELKLEGYYGINL